MCNALDDLDAKRYNLRLELKKVHRDIKNLNKEINSTQCDPAKKLLNLEELSSLTNIQLQLIDNYQVVRKERATMKEKIKAMAKGHPDAAVIDSDHGITSNHMPEIDPMQRTQEFIESQNREQEQNPPVRCPSNPPSICDSYYGPPNHPNRYIRPTYRPTEANAHYVPITGESRHIKVGDGRTVCIGLRQICCSS